MVDLEEILARAETAIARDGYDPATVIGAALEYLAEKWADDDRELCPICLKRRMGYRQVTCVICADALASANYSKIKWWRANGDDYRRQRREEQRRAQAEPLPAEPLPAEPIPT